MQRLTPFQWVSVLTLVIALAPGAASAQEAGTVTISGVFSMDYGSDVLDLYYLDPGLATAYANGYEHTWTLTLHGTTQSHATNGWYYGTDIHAASFDLEFFGPDAAALNGYVSDYLAGGDASAYLQNTYYNGGGLAIMHVVVSGSANGAYFYSGHDIGVDTLFPADADGYPVVRLEPFAIQPDYTELGYYDLYSGTVAIGSLAGPVTFAGSVGEPVPVEPVFLAVADASVLEGNRGTTWLNLTVALSRYPDDVVTVDYETVDGSARNKSDYTATSGTLLFWPDEISHTISIAIKADRKREADETFTVWLSNVVGATISDGVATATILNDD